MRIVDAAALSGFARNTADAASDFAEVIFNLIMEVRDSYRPGLHYMRGPARNGAPGIVATRLSPPDNRTENTKLSS
ncbi:hypothetical protein ABIE89_008452 [Bradyrhizobium niftali]|uniref:hypothetical protein n=1 Tax=Bradyrhizobium niftali TaxID=2560055 RepID=UPI003835619F